MGPGPNPHVHGIPASYVGYFSKDIKRESNWGYWYTIEGKRLAEMRPLNVLITFPDGVSAFGSLKVVNKGMTYNDMGHACHGTDEEIRLVIPTHGHEFERVWTIGDPISFSFETLVAPIKF